MAATRLRREAQQQQEQANGNASEGTLNSKRSVSTYEVFVARWALGLDSFYNDNVLRDLARSRAYARHGLSLECEGADDISLDARAYAKRESIWGVVTPSQLAHAALTVAFAQARNLKQMVMRGTAKMGSAAVLLVCTLVIPYYLPYNDCENPVFYTRDRSVQKVFIATGLLCFDALEFMVTLRGLGARGGSDEGHVDAPLHPRNRRFANTSLAQLSSGATLLCVVGALFFSYAFYLTIPLTKLRGVKYDS